MKCPKCGNEISPSDKFCTSCGEKIESVRYCQNCGKPIDGRFCTNCGTDSQQQAIPQTATPSVQKGWGYPQPYTPPQPPTYQTSKTVTIIQQQPSGSRSGLHCPRCHSTNIDSSVFAQPQKTGCLMVIIYIILACTIVGWLVLIPLIAGNSRSKQVTAFVCKNCGHTWRR